MNDNIPDNFTLFQCILLQKNQRLTNAEKLSLLQTTRTSLLQYLLQYNTLHQLKEISFKAIINSILTTPIQILSLIVVHDHTPVSNLTIYIIWGKKVLKYKELYKHLAQHLHLFIVFGGNNLYQCLSSIVFPLHIARLEKQNGEYIKTNDDIQFEQTIRVCCLSKKEEKSGIPLVLSSPKQTKNHSLSNIKTLLSFTTLSKISAIFSKPRELLTSMNNALKVKSLSKDKLSISVASINRHYLLM